MIRVFFLLILLPFSSFGQENALKIYEERIDGFILIFADNYGLTPQTVVINVESKGLKVDKPLPKHIVVQGKKRNQLLAKFIVPKNRGWTFSYKFEYMEGDVDAVHNDEYVYQLPFAQGSSFRMTQGYNGRFTHQGVNALDFTMPEGETVVAAREGLVVKVREDSNRGCASNRCIDDSNFVRILHKDGTMAEYHHLQQNGAIVAEGDKVKRGQPIGRSGATGYVSGPHLHFLVFKTDGQKQIDFKTRFEYAKGKVSFLETGVRYKAFE
ncbi:M23 family metallopeptidase [Roseivirga sp.]|uniref:M23 family metallopeptidase n=1 Tax=Roseivirga sp. TaxID=1964215 RepID=UPI003B8BD751